VRIKEIREHPLEALALLMLFIQERKRSGVALIGYLEEEQTDWLFFKDEIISIQRIPLSKCHYAKDIREGVCSIKRKQAEF